MTRVPEPPARPRAWLVAGSLLVALHAAAPGLLAAQQAPAEQEAVAAGPAQNAIAGSRLFASKGCIRCHAINGMGGREGPDLGQSPEVRTFYGLAARMWNHIPGMRERMEEIGFQPPRVRPDEIGDLVAFLYSVHYFDPKGDVIAGRKQFREKQCIRCHQVQGVGGVIGPSLERYSQFGSPIAVAAAMWNHGPAMESEMRTRGVERREFRGDELVNLTAYIESAASGPRDGPLYTLPGRADRGRILFSQKSCIECHSVRGVGGDVGPDLAEQGRHRSLTQFAAAMWNKSSVMVAAMEARGIVVPELKPDEMADIVAYLYSVRYFDEAGRPSAGRRRLRDKGCLDCHSLEGRGGTVASDLGSARGLGTPTAVIAALWNHVTLTDESSAGHVVDWPLFTPREVADLVAWFQTPPPTP
ncbi:MAG: c-type cytochrome [Gemmatimonadota bacterium]